MLGRTKLQSTGWWIDDNNYVNFASISKTLTDDPIDVTAGYWSAISANEYIIIENNSQWSGVHKVQSVNSLGHVQTYTKSSKKYNTGVLSTTISNCNLTAGIGGAGSAGGYLTADDDSGVFVNLALSVGDFVWITGAGSGDNGMYEVTSLKEVDGGAESSQLAYLGNKYFLNTEDDITEFQNGDSHITTDTAVTVRRIKYDPSYINVDAEYMEDESFNLDLTDYQSQAIVYYMKAKLAEDTRDLEGREYFMRLFKNKWKKPQVLERQEFTLFKAFGG